VPADDRRESHDFAVAGTIFETEWDPRLKAARGLTEPAVTRTGRAHLQGSRSRYR
jgi:hypothetical protein